MWTLKMNLASLTPLLPEIIIALGAMALLMIGAFAPVKAPRDAARYGEIIGYLAIALLGGALYSVVGGATKTISLFDGAFIADSFSRFMKVLILIGAAASIMLSFDYLKNHKLMSLNIPFSFCCRLSA